MVVVAVTVVALLAPTVAPLGAITFTNSVIDCPGARPAARPVIVFRLPVIRGSFVSSVLPPSAS